jgi:hypothetical protein
VHAVERARGDARVGDVRVEAPLAARPAFGERAERRGAGASTVAPSRLLESPSAITTLNSKHHTVNVSKSFRVTPSGSVRSYVALLALWRPRMRSTRNSRRGRPDRPTRRSMPGAVPAALKPETRSVRASTTVAEPETP